jgi:hypothetical protein
MLIHGPGLVDEPHYINAVNSIGLLEGVNPDVAPLPGHLDYYRDLDWDFHLDWDLYWDFYIDRFGLIEAVQRVVSFCACCEGHH